MNKSFLWHDYETWGINPAHDKIAQFAAIRTDYDFNIIGDPIKLYCQLPKDYLPSPQAMLVTHLIPQVVNEKGLTEPQFIKKIHDTMTVAHTCSVGYNSIRFDDEVTRYALYRNFYDPYEREWKNHNSRWDIIDLIRACYALRPDGIQWYFIDDKPSFKLAYLSKVNHINHDMAHDALSDVYATIGLAKLIKEKQPKLFEWYFKLRNKKEVKKEIDTINMKPFIHVSGFFSSQFACCSILMPMLWDYNNNNALITLDLRYDPKILFDLSIEEIIEKRYEKGSDIKIPIHTISINKCPFIAPIGILKQDETIYDRIQLDKNTVGKHLDFVKAHHHQIKDIIHQLLEKAQQKEQHYLDAESALYQNFFSDHDKVIMSEIRQTLPEKISHLHPQFTDKRLSELFFLYKSRWFPHLLNETELYQWHAHCQEKLNNQAYFNQLNEIYETESDENKKLLGQLITYIKSL